MHMHGVVAENETAVTHLASKVGNQIGREIDTKLNGIA
jgi:hypothetical protein